MNLIGAVVAALLVFALLVVGILIWARRTAGRSQEADTRMHYITLAGHAAGDASGAKFFELLKALEEAPADCPVKVQWLRHMPANKEPGMLVKITWDGNEWRRVMDWERFKGQVRTWVEQDPECGARVKQLLDDLERH